MNTKRVLVAVFVVIVVAVGALSASTVLTNADYDPHGGTNWHTDVTVAREQAQSSNSPMLVYFWSENCGACQDFNEELQGNAELQDALDGYVLVSAKYADAEGLRERYDVSRTPTVVVVTPEGERVTTFVPSGVENPAETLERAREQATETTA